MVNWNLLIGVTFFGSFLFLIAWIFYRNIRFWKELPVRANELGLQYSENPTPEGVAEILPGDEIFLPPDLREDLVQRGQYYGSQRAIISGEYAGRRIHFDYLVSKTLHAELYCKFAADYPFCFFVVEGRPGSASAPYLAGYHTVHNTVIDTLRVIVKSTNETALRKVLETEEGLIRELFAVKGVISILVEPGLVLLKAILPEAEVFEPLEKLLSSLESASRVNGER